MDYKLPVRTFIKKDIQKGRSPLLPNCVGHTGMKPVYGTDRPLDSMDGMLGVEPGTAVRANPGSWKKISDPQDLVIFNQARKKSS
jgi:hypothetical protein